MRSRQTLKICISVRVDKHNLNFDMKGGVSNLFELGQCSNVVFDYIKSVIYRIALDLEFWH